MADAGIDPRLAEFHAPPVDLSGTRQVSEQLTVAAANIEDARAWRHHLGDEAQVAANVDRRRGAAEPVADRIAVGAHRRGSITYAPNSRKCPTHANAKPRCSAQPVRKPPSVAKNSFSSSRKASWPLSVAISTKLTFAAAALRAWTMARFSAVGYSQSLVKDMTQKRVLGSRKAFARIPPCSAA